MATAPKVTLRKIAWRHIHPDGSETVRTGIEWADGAPLAGMRTWWVKADDDASMVLVARASRRHTVGRATNRWRRTIEGRGEWRQKWDPSGGRYVDIGEYFSEADPRSRFARSYVPPTHVVMAKMDAGAETDLANFARTCERLERGEDVGDMSVDGQAAADAANVEGTL